MAWRQILAAALVTVTLGCDRPVNSNPLAVNQVATTTPIGVPLQVVSGTSTLTTTVFPVTPLTVPVGSTLTCVDPLPLVPTAGTVNNGIGPSTAGVIAPTGQAVRLLTPGTFTFSCAFIPTIVVTIIVV
ncbi:MAG TPA: hypothetical protein VKB36_22305 [Vicinamibacterales bacterium]|nr:hypothetical protein [Vicinamibacterales bacterium]